MKKSKNYILIAKFLLLLLGAVIPCVNAQAQETQLIKNNIDTESKHKNTISPIDIVPAEMAQSKGLIYDINEITHPEIQITPDKSELVRLDDDAASIIIGNPGSLNIQAESARLLVLTPLSPGATYFTALNKDGNVIMQRHVIVASPKEKYMRVRRSCSSSGNKNCQETSVYYCPDMCHQIMMADPAAAAQKTSATDQNATGPLPEIVNTDKTDASNAETEPSQTP